MNTNKMLLTLGMVAAGVGGVLWWQNMRDQNAADTLQPGADPNGGNSFAPGSSPSGFINWGTWGGAPAPVGDDTVDGSGIPTLPSLNSMGNLNARGGVSESDFWQGFAT